jgi:hypothetical protein
MMPAPLQWGRRPRVGAEQRGLHTVGLCERLADRVEQSGIRRRVVRREPGSRSRSTATTPSRPATRSVISELLPDPATPVRHAEHASGMSTLTSRGLCSSRRGSQRAGRLPHRVLRADRSSKWRPGSAAGPRPSTVPSGTRPPPVPAPGRGHDVVGDCDRLGSCSRPARCCPCPQPQRRVVHPLDVMRVQARGGSSKTLR